MEAAWGNQLTTEYLSLDGLLYAFFVKLLNFLHAHCLSGIMRRQYEILHD